MKKKKLTLKYGSCEMIHIDGKFIYIGSENSICFNNSFLLYDVIKNMNLNIICKWCFDSVYAKNPKIQSNYISLTKVSQVTNSSCIWPNIYNYQYYLNFASSAKVAKFKLKYM